MIGRHPSPQPEGVLLEREIELQALTGCIEAAVRGEGCTVAIEGAAGIGKSCLIACAERLAATTGMQVLTARGGELEREFPYGVVRQLFESPVLSAPQRERRRLLAGAARFATPALTLAPQDGTLAGERGAVLHGLYWLTANLAVERPLLIAVDDAHWADDGSLQFLSYLARRADELAVLIVYCARTGEGASERLPGAAEPSLARVVLRPAALSESAASELIAASLGRQVPERFTRACHSESAGNPFLLTELLRALAADGIATADASSERVAQVAPTTIGRAILARLRRLGGPATQLAFAVAVLGSQADLRHAAELAGLTLDAAGQAADDLAAAAILSDTRPLEFIHPVVRTTVYAELAPARRASAHKRAARMIEELDNARLIALAAHLLATEPAADAWVVDRLRSAAAAVIVTGSPHAAARYLRRALREPPTEAIRADVLLELGRAAAIAGEPAAAYLVQAHELAPDLPTKATAALELSRALAFAGDLRSAVDVLENALTDLGARREDLARTLESGLFTTAVMNSAARKLVVRRIDEAWREWRAGETPMSPSVLSVLAIESVATGTADDAAELATHALADGSLLKGGTSETPTFYFATCALALADRFDAAERHLGAAVGEARARGSARGFATASCFRAFARYREGDVPGAELDLTAALELTAVPGLAAVRTVLFATLVNCLVERGALDEADARLAEVDRDSLDPESVLSQLLHASAAGLRIAQQRPRDALVELALCAAWATRWHVTSPAWISWRSTAALVHATLGDSEQAAHLADVELARAREFGGARTLAIALRTSGQLAGGERGLELLRQAVAHGQRSSARLEHARALTELGAAMRRAGERARSREPLREALDLASRCGALHLAQRAREELVAAGARPRRMALTGPDALTASERRVVQIAAGGLANREIAQALFVTVRTVECHLTKAYEKLGISSRDQLAGALGKLENRSARHEAH